MEKKASCTLRSQIERLPLWPLLLSTRSKYTPAKPERVTCPSTAAKPRNHIDEPLGLALGCASCAVARPAAACQRRAGCGCARGGERRLGGAALGRASLLCARLGRCLLPAEVRDDHLRTAAVAVTGSGAGGEGGAALRVLRRAGFH